MKHIVKQREPDTFSEWKTLDKMAHRPNWNRVPADIKRDVHLALIQEQGFLCCYCQALVNPESSHVEHFRPRSKLGYRHLQLDYTNLHGSCGRDSVKGEPRQCGFSKGDWFDEQLLISPLDAACEVRFRFTGDGRIRPAPGDAAEAAAQTIKRLALDLPKLDKRRQEVLHTYTDLSIPDLEMLLAQPDPEGRFVPFYTAVKDVLLP